MAFGGANAALGMMLPLLENHFNVRQRSIRTAVDFEGSRPVIYLKAAFSLTIGQGVVLAVRLGFQALRILSQYKSGQKTERGGLTMEKNHPIGDLMSTTMQKIREMVDVNTIIGTPIRTDDGITLIPVSKLSFGFASGGSDFVTKNQKPEADNAFGGGGGAGVNISPWPFSS